MKEYVDAERILNKEDLPLGSILKIVTCDECKHCVERKLYKTSHYFCELTNTWMPRGHFCAYGDDSYVVEVV